MSSNAFKLGLPTDIPWSKICVSEDMMDKNICDGDFLPKWSSSIAVFKYVPDEEYQTHKDHDLIYFKVSVSLTGHQPKDKEIEGIFDKDGMTVDVIKDVEYLLNEYHPCTGAIIQVMVGPSKDDEVKYVEDYPYFIDFEPKKRELYELASETKEKMSRSLQQLSIGKSAQSTQSLEVLDVDMGGSWSFGAQANTPTGGGGVDAGGSTSGQWGTKEMNSHQTGVLRSSDNSNERRETESFTTQLSQLYHLLDAYHLGTNRALFLLEPRPHVISQQSGFVRGPRPMDGIQELFLVVAKPKNQKDVCISVRLDTAHLAVSDIMEHAKGKDTITLSTSASPPAKNDPQAEHVGYAYQDVSVGISVGTRKFKCYDKKTEDSTNYIVARHHPDFIIDIGNGGGYKVESHDFTRDKAGKNINPASDGESLFAQVWATSHKCHYISGGKACLVNCKDVLNESSAYSTLNLTLNLKSREPILKTGTRKHLIITTRGLCCCPTSGISSINYDEFKKPSTIDGLIYEIPLDALINENKYELGLRHHDLTLVEKYASGNKESNFDISVGQFSDTSLANKDTSDLNMELDSNDLDNEGLLTVAQANTLTALMMKELRTQTQSFTNREPIPYLASDFFTNKLETRLRQNAQTRHLRKNNLAEHNLDKTIISALTKYFESTAKEILPSDIARIPLNELQRITNISLEEVTALRLKMLGVSVLDKSHKGFPKAKKRKNFNATRSSQNEK